MLDMWNREHTNPERRNTSKPLKWILLDSIIIGLLALWAVSPATVPTQTDFWVMFRAFLGGLIFQLIAELGIKPAWTARKEKKKAETK